MVTFTTPLSIGYRTSHTAQLTRYTLTGASGGNSIHVVNAGVENLTTIGGSDGEIRFENAAYSWAKNVEVTQWIGEGVAIDGSFRIELRDSYIHTGSWPEPGGAGYAISFAEGSSEALVENNISIDVNKMMVFRSSGTGSVVAYNYTDDGWIYGSEIGGGRHQCLAHGRPPSRVVRRQLLYQRRQRLHSRQRHLLDFLPQLADRDTRDFTDNSGNSRTAGLAYGSWWDSFVGNILGISGQMSGWNYTDPGDELRYQRQ